jgi:predicted phage terminase large subunit-like protein
MKEILDYEDIEPGVHGEQMRRMGGPERRKLILWPRGTFKTTVITIGGAIQSILKMPNIRILLDSEVLDYTMKILGQVKRDLQKPKVVELFGNLVDSKRRENSREFTITTRTNLGLKEPTIYAAGIGTVQVGPHYDLIFADDLHSEKNVATRDQIDKVKSHYRLLLSLLEPNGILVIAGTRWHHLDLYSFILEEESVDDPNWYVSVESAIRQDGSLFFPQRLTKEFLAEQRKSQGSYLFSVLYQNSPISPEDAIFKKQDIMYWEGDSYPMAGNSRLPLNLYLTIDRAFSTRENADYTGCVLTGTSEDGNLYVLEAERKKCGVQELFDLVHRWVVRYGQDRVRKVAIESSNWEELEVYFKEQMRKSHFYFSLERILPDNQQSKERRIMTALQARYENHTIFHKKGVLLDLEDELLRFPKGTHDDLIDALAAVVPLMTMPGNAITERDDFDYQPSGWFGNTGY